MNSSSAWRSDISPQPPLSLPREPSWLGGWRGTGSRVARPMIPPASEVYLSLIAKVRAVQHAVCHAGRPCLVHLCRDPVESQDQRVLVRDGGLRDRKSTRLNSSH